MAKFKVGDKVEVRDYPAESWLGRGSVDHADDRYVIIDFDDGRRGGFDNKFVFPLALGPIRTVTRREIVPGTYGNVTVEVDGDGPFIYISDSISSADELREAAHLFNQLAEVLEENAAADKKEAA